VDDRYGQIYLPGQMWLSRSDIVGRVKRYATMLAALGVATIVDSRAAFLHVPATCPTLAPSRFG